MSVLADKPSPRGTAELAAKLAGRRFGLCGFDTEETRRIAGALAGSGAVAMPCDERLVGQSAPFCDGFLIRLETVTENVSRAVALSTTPVLVVGPSRKILEGASAAYCWPQDFMDDRWSAEELVVRLFRLVDGRSEGIPDAESRVGPLVLVADDDPELVALVDATLRNDKITCRAADNGLSSLRAAREFRPDLLVLDVRMPDFDGFQVLEVVRRDPRLQGMPVVMLTGCDEPADVVRGAELRADDYLGKPVSPNMLLNRVRRLLSRSPRRWSRAISTGKPWVSGAGLRPGAGVAR